MLWQRFLDSLIIYKGLYTLSASVPWPIRDMKQFIVSRRNPNELQNKFPLLHFWEIVYITLGIHLLSDIKVNHVLTTRNLFDYFTICFHRLKNRLRKSFENINQPSVISVVINLDQTKKNSDTSKRHFGIYDVCSYVIIITALYEDSFHAWM